MRFISVGGSRGFHTARYGKREYSLSEIAIITRAGPARALGLKRKGHLGVGADGDVAIYGPQADRATMFARARHAIKDGRAIGRMNDAVLYGGRAWYTVRADDAQTERVIEQLPSSASRDYGTPFYDLFQRYDCDFYKIDPLLFSVAEISINNLTSGRVFHAGRVNCEMVRRSFLG